MTILILTNHDIGLYNFRKELLKRLLDMHYKVFIALPGGGKVINMIQMGCSYRQTQIDRRGMNPVKDLFLFKSYIKLMREVKPDVVLTYTMKPNIYGGFAARIKRIPSIVNITGLGAALREDGAIQKILIFLLKISLKQAYVFFQNKENKDFFERCGILGKAAELLPGSGVNLEEFSYMSYPISKPIRFVFIARIMKEKGIDEFLLAVKHIKSKYSEIQFDICGFIEDCRYEKIIQDYQKENLVTYHGLVDDMKEIYQNCHCIILPSYREGLSNVILEAAACGRAAIASDIPGCKEVITHQVTGLLMNARDVEDLVAKIEIFINFTDEERKKMGEKAREKIEKEFDRKKVVDAYINRIIKTQKR